MRWIALIARKLMTDILLATRRRARHGLKRQEGIRKLRGTIDWQGDLEAMRSDT
jgi:hypothetical protein